MKVSAILLSAGHSLRMEPLGHKGLLPWGGKTLFEYQLEMLKRASLSETIAVIGYKADIFLQLSKPYAVKVIHNNDFHKGKCSSILIGLEAIHPTSEHILITAVDQPTHPAIINLLVQSLQDTACPIAIPTYKGKRGHPILFSSRIKEDLLTIQEKTEGLRHIIRKYENQILEVDIDHPFIKLNLNTPNDYQYALGLKEVYSCSFQK